MGDPARLPQAGRHGGRLAVHQGPLHRPMALRLTYEPRDVLEGTAISIMGWMSWAVCAWPSGCGRPRPPASPPQSPPAMRE